MSVLMVSLMIMSGCSVQLKYIIDLHCLRDILDPSKVMSFCSV